MFKFIEIKICLDQIKTNVVFLVSEYDWCVESFNVISGIFKKNYCKQYELRDEYWAVIKKWGYVVDNSFFPIIKQSWPNFLRWCECESTAEKDTSLKRFMMIGTNYFFQVQSTPKRDGASQQRPHRPLAHPHHGRRPLLHRQGVLLRTRLVRRRDGHLGRREPRDEFQGKSSAHDTTQSAVSFRLIFRPRSFLISFFDFDDLLFHAHPASI